VKVPEIDLLMAWNTFSERQKQLRQERAKPPKYAAVVQRAHAQYDSGSRIGTIRRLPPIPDRRGRRTAHRTLWLRLLSSLLVIIALLLTTGFAFTSNAFRIEQVNVVGTTNPKLIEVIQRMGM
jgi:hypothetical protein